MSPSAPLAGLFVLFLGATTCFAAPDAGAKARGDFGFYGHGAHAGLSSARTHTENYQRYLRDTHGVEVPAHRETPADLPTTAIVVERPGTARPVAATPAADHVDQIARHGEVLPEIAREASDAIADDIERVQRHFTRMRVLATRLEDGSALEILASAEKRLGDARRAHAALHDHHASETIAPVTAMDLAQRVNDALRAAHADYDRLSRRLGRDDGGEGR